MKWSTHMNKIMVQLMIVQYLMAKLLCHRICEICRSRMYDQTDCIVAYSEAYQDQEHS